MKRLDLTGHKYGKLSVISFARMAKASQSIWNCRCDCGGESAVSLGNLRSGHVVSCGCQGAIANAKRLTTHGMTGTSEYKTWQGMLTRCENPDNHKYPAYGGRGIKVSKRWRKFENFFSDMGNRPSGTTLGRKDNDGHYCKRNCEWQDATTQGRNKRNNIRYLFNGRLATIAEHCEILGLKYATVKSRLYLYKWPVEKAFSTQPT